MVKRWFVVFLVVSAFTALVTDGNPVAAATFGIGDTVEVYNTGESGLVVRGPTSCGSQIGGKFDGATGTVIDGPIFCSSHTRWKVQWSDGLVGWSAENWLRKVQTPAAVTLTLYVRDGSVSGPVIVGAQVTGQDANGASFNQTTNASGYVTITGAPGTWSFTASKSGYQSETWSMSVPATETKIAFLQKTADTTKPQVDSLSVSPGSVAVGSSFTIFYTVSDTGGSGLKQAELWRAPDSGGSPGGWAQVDSKTASGGSASGSFTNAPSSAGAYWYGIHAVDNAGNWAAEDAPVQVTATPAAVYNTAFLTDKELEDYSALTTDQIRALFASHNSYFGREIQDSDGQAFEPALVITEAAREYRINPKVLLTTLQNGEQWSHTRDPTIRHHHAVSDGVCVAQHG